MLKSCYPCQLNHTLALELNIVQIHQHVQEPAEKMPHTKKKREDAAPKPEECIGKYVCIEHDGRAYPGFVGDTDLAQVYVNCMHSVGKERLNRF